VSVVSLGAGPSRVQARRAQTRRAVLDAAWALASGSGLEALSLRDIAASVGMRAPSLYSYFDSKAAILDALFVDGYRALDDQIAAVAASQPAKASPTRRLAALLQMWIGFCQDDQARYRLLFTNAVPGWVASAEAYQSSLDSYLRLCDYLAGAGITEADDIDLVTALAAGLVAQQMANDPGGDRWLRRVDDVVDMFVQHLRAHRKRATHLPEDRP